MKEMDMMMMGPGWGGIEEYEREQKVATIVAGLARQGDNAAKMKKNVTLAFKYAAVIEAESKTRHSAKRKYNDWTHGISHLEHRIKSDKEGIIRRKEMLGKGHLIPERAEHSKATMVRMKSDIRKNQAALRKLRANPVLKPKV